MAIENEGTGAPVVEGAGTIDQGSEPTPEEAALSAMDEGIAAVSVQDDAAATPAPTPAPAAAAPNDDGATAADGAVKPEGATQPETPAAAAPNAETEQEIVTLGLKEASAERFRSLSNEVRELAPLRDALKTAGIDDVAALPTLVQESRDYRDLIGMVQSTGASPEQYGMALDYIKAVNAAQTGDRQAAERAYSTMEAELKALATMLGKPVPGVYDPLQEFPDLAKMVTDGDMTPAAAAELAGLRKGQALEATGRQVQQQVASQRQQQEYAQQQAEQQGTNALNRLGAELAASDPQFAMKAPALVAKLQEVREKVHPSEWESVARALYSMIQAPAAAAPAPARPAAKPTPGPVRGLSLHQSVMPTTDDPMEALEQGIAAASM